MDLTPKIMRGPFVDDLRDNNGVTEVYVGDGKWMEVQQELMDRKSEAKRWKDIATYLFDCHAATAWSEGMKSTTSKSSRRRFISILETSIEFFLGRRSPRHPLVYAETRTPEQMVIDRAGDAIRDLRSRI